MQKAYKLESHKKYAMDSMLVFFMAVILLWSCALMKSGGKPNE